MAFTDGAQAPDESGQGPGSPPPGGGAGAMSGPPQAGGLLTALRSQQAGPSPSVPGQGTQANGLMTLKSAMDLIEQSLPMLESGSRVYNDAIGALRSLSRHLPQGAPTAGVQQTQIRDLFGGILRSAMLQKLRGQGTGRGGAPMPSTPLPGA